MPDVKNIAGATVGGLGGLVGGAKAGAAVGLILGPVGAGVGAIVGGLAGAFFFGKAGYEDPSRGAIMGITALATGAASPDGSQQA